MGNIELPVTIPNKLLISPGVWNDNEYSTKEIEDAFSKTDWTDKSKISLWLNHDDTNTSAFVGYVKNPSLASKGRVFGDLELWDEKSAILLTEAMAKFGVSAKIRGEEDKKGKMHHFTFENFSIVTTPACSEAYINLSKKEEERKITSKYLDTGSYYTNERGLERMGKDLQKEDKKEEDKKEEDKKEEDLQKDEVKKEEPKEEAEESKDNELSAKVEELSNKFDKLIEILSKKELQEEDKSDEEKSESSESESESESSESEEKKSELKKEVSEMELIKKELSLLKGKLNAPKSKTVRNLSSNTVGNEQFNENLFCDFLSDVNSPTKFQ